MTPSNTKTETKVPAKPAIASKSKPAEKSEVPTPKNPANYKKAVALGQELSKKPDTTKMDVATKMYDLIKDLE